MELTQEYLKSILIYNPLTGIFTWKERSDVNKDWNTRYAGKTAGGLRQDGYIRISINGLRYMAHRLAFLWMEGEIPKNIDHIDRRKDNNIWTNLRKASATENGANVEKRSHNTSGYKNVTWAKDKNKWRVQVYKEGIKFYGGSFHKDNLKEAVDAANELRFQLYGQFALYEEFKE